MTFPKIFLGVAVCALALVSTPQIANAQPSASGLPLPRFVSLRSDEVNMRTGPGVRYPVDWVYKRRNMPMEVVAEFGTWRKVRDVQGSEGWIHQSMLSNRRMIAVTGQIRTLRGDADASASAVARLEPGTVGEIKNCPEKSSWCQLSFGGHDGWLRRVEFWGVYPKERIK
ncbi:MAG: SH3 domain-containing protein [Rhodospirillaceae bacterium]|jgi:SH3-like domain-containing protein